MTTLFKSISPSYLPHKYSEKQILIGISLFFAVLQFTIRLGCMGRYGFHQDELLYMSLGNHLSWGFKETPPFIAFASFIITNLFGDSVFIVRILPSLTAAALIYLTGLTTIRLGGKYFAVLIACAGITFSSAFVATGSLFIPQVFDELCWFLTAYLCISYIKQPKKSQMLLLGVVVGTGLLVKHTILLYAIGLVFGLLLSKESRRMFQSKYFYIALCIAFIIFLPNLIWQFQHNFPAINHYKELRETQLIYISRWDFVYQQLFVNGTTSILWMLGILLVYTQKAFKPYRFLAIAYVFAAAVLIILNGKTYYLFGAYPPLFALGAIFLELLFKSKSWKFKNTFLTLFTLPNLILMSIVLPYLPIETASKVFEWSYKNLNIHFPLKWEDQKIHNMNQNYADMIGWDELAKKSSLLYLSLTPAEQRETIIVAENYGEAGAIDYYKKKYRLPALISLSSSYATWAPSSIRAKHMIYLSDEPILSNELGEIHTISEVKDPYSRIKGMDIVLVKDINNRFKKNYKQEWLSTQ